jgi:hypothetical protein
VRDDVGVTFTLSSRHGRAIETLEDWRIHASPASEKHWKDGRSAKELAKAWIRGTGPTDLARLLDLQPQTSSVMFQSAVAEEQIAFDRFPGGKRNHDLLIRGTTKGGQVVVGLEAKADERFGQTVKRYLADGLALRQRGKTTNAPERLSDLLRGVADTNLDRTPDFGDLRYQLFSGVAGTLAATEPGQIAVFVVHEFATEMTNAAKRDANRLDLAQFVRNVTGDIPPAEDWWLRGPYFLPAGRWRHTPLYIGHMTTPGIDP